jgi:hypothetical protein
VITVIVTTLPASVLSGMYVKLNGDEVSETGTIDPFPSDESVTSVALPPNVLLSMVTGVKKQVVPLIAPKARTGGLLQRFWLKTLVGIRMKNAEIKIQPHILADNTI